jgi:glycine/D-amino acid oxidase-like deaminating enzyme
MSEQTGFNTRPIWFDATVIPKQTPQSAQICVDVCIIGGGITGLTAAELLKREGKTVAVVDLDRVVRGETGHTSGHITEVFDMGYRSLISNFGVDGAKLGAQAMRRAVERIEENVAKKGIDCGLERVSGWRYTDEKSKIDELEEDAEAAKLLGIPCELSFEVPLPFHVERGLRFDRQAQFNSVAYVAGLMRGIAGDGSYIFEETRMIDIEEGEPCRVKTDRGTITDYSCTRRSRPTVRMRSPRA